MKRTMIRSLPLDIDQDVCIKGWIQKVRDQKTMQFVIVRDHTGTVQITHEKGDDDLSRLITSLTVESAVVVEGKVISNQAVKLGGIEVIPTSLEIVNAAPGMLPIRPDSDLEHRMDWRFLDLRLPKNQLILQVQTTAERAMRDFWEKNEFTEIHSPKLMGAASESGAELFTLKYFGGLAYLAQSPQFYKQMAIAGGFDRVFEVGPVFRANPSFTSRHDTEFTSVDEEIAWIDSHEDVMAMEEAWLHHILSTLKLCHGETIKELFGADVVVPQLPFPRVTMAEAYEILAQKGHILSPETKGDLDPEGERTLCAVIKERTGHEFVFVKDYPTSVRPFYHMRHNGNPLLTKSFDLLWKGLEVTTGAQREHRYDVLMDQVREKGLNPEPIKHYLECFRHGCPPHGGFGFGLTRMLMVLLNVKNVREVTFLYRGPNRLVP